MTLRLVSDNSEPKTSIQIAEQCRKLADAIEAGKHGEVSRVAICIEYDGGLCVEGWGEHVCSYEMMGLFEAGKLRVFAETMDELED